MRIIQPTQTLSIKNKDYQEGQVIKNDGRKWLIHLDDKNTNLAQLMPVIEAKKKVNLIVYIPGNKISTIKESQTVHFQVPNANGATDLLTGSVKNIAVYPVNIKNNNVYAVLCDVKVRQNSGLRYGMEGKATVVTGKTTYFNFIKNKILNR